MKSASRQHAQLPCRAGGAKRRAAAKAVQPAQAAARPVNRKGVLQGREGEIVRLYAGGQGRRISSIARTYKVSCNAIRKVLGLTRKPPGGGGRRARSHCDFCGDEVLVQASTFRAMCGRCSARASEILTIWSRERGDTEETLPRNLRPYLQG
jgi:hypothetical protein